MKRIAVFVATTGGPVRVERITRERAPQSMVCLKRSSTVLPISASYDSFVRPGSGVIDRVFGPFEDNAFRLDVSAPIETGESWQLGFFVAHALCAYGGALAAEDDADEIAWLTGHVDYDLAVGGVGHLAEKVHAARAAMTAWLAAGRPVSLFVRDGADIEAAVSAGIPDGARVVAVTAAADALSVLGIPMPGAMVPAITAVPARPFVKTRSAVWLAGAFAASAVAAVALSQWIPPPAPPQAANKSPQAAMTPAANAVSEKTVTEKPAVEVMAPSQPAAVKVPATTPPVAAPPPVPAKLSILERRAPPGRSCADVQFGAAAAVEAPAPEASTLLGLCGLAVAIDNEGPPGFVAVNLDMISGRLLYGTVRPEVLAGETPFRGRQEWAIDLPRRMPGPFEFKITAVSGAHAVAGAADWLKSQSDPAAAARTLSAQGLSLAVAHHRVVP